MPHADGRHSVRNDSVGDITSMNVVACDKTSHTVITHFLNEGRALNNETLSLSEG